MSEPHDPSAHKWCVVNKKGLFGLLWPLDVALAIVERRGPDHPDAPFVVKHVSEVVVT